MKVVINKCHGGFGLSNVAFEALLDKKGIAWEKTADDGSLIGPNYYQKGHLGDKEYFISEYDHYESRNCQALIQIVEKFGSDANGWASELKILEIPDDVEWTVMEYDGLEWVAEKHRTWS